ncbi:MAG: hypothetical protein B6V02_02535 [Thermoprotei archaeon ex4572_64]|nr:MAG: hypothetical protein B6V02_02535 [Thermoprotei archaeon ex4572_64]
MSNVNEKLWSLLAWCLSIVGVIITYLIGPKTDFVKFWLKNSIAFFIIMILLGLSVVILDLIPIIGWIVSTVIKILGGVGLTIVWIVGIIKIIEGDMWNIPIITDIAKRVPIP